MKPDFIYINKHKFIYVEYAQGFHFDIFNISNGNYVTTLPVNDLEAIYTLTRCSEEDLLYIRLKYGI